MGGRGNEWGTMAQTVGNGGPVGGCDFCGLHFGVPFFRGSEKKSKNHRRTGNTRSLRLTTISVFKSSFLRQARLDLTQIMAVAEAQATAEIIFVQRWKPDIAQSRCVVRSSSSGGSTLISSQVDLLGPKELKGRLESHFGWARHARARARASHFR